jgi:hypothetical protein
LELDSIESKLRLLLVYLYSRNNEASYTSESLGVMVKVNGLSFVDFIIKRRV